MSAATVAAVAVVAGATAYSAKSSSSASKKANAANLQNAASDREQARYFFEEGRGAGGFAQLPLFATDENGNPVEPTLFADSLSTYRALQRDPQEELAYLTGIRDDLAPAQRGAVDTATGLFDGRLEQEAVGNLQPVFAARNADAEVVAQAGRETLADQLNRIAQIQAQKGFSGDSFGANRLAFEAGRTINTEAARAKSQAKLLNAQEEAGVRNTALQTRLANVGLPTSLQQLQVGSYYEPENALVDANARRLSVFQPFNIGTGQFTFSPTPRVEATPSTGQIVSQGIASFAGQYAQQQAQQKAFAQNQAYLNYLQNQGAVNSLATQQSALGTGAASDTFAFFGAN